MITLGKYLNPDKRGTKFFLRRFVHGVTKMKLMQFFKTFSPLLRNKSILLMIKWRGLERAVERLAWCHSPVSFTLGGYQNKHVDSSHNMLSSTESVIPASPFVGRCHFLPLLCVPSASNQRLHSTWHLLTDGWVPLPSSLGVESWALWQPITL